MPKVELTVDGSTLHLYLSSPEDSGARPVVVGKHAGGGDPFIEGMCDRLAEVGYVAARPTSTIEALFACFTRCRDDQGRG